MSVGDSERWLKAAGSATWTLVERYTGRVGYKRGVKAEGLDHNPPVIDCSGWTALLLSVGMAAANRQSARQLFSDADIMALHTWSDRLIENIERRSGFILTGDQISADTLPPFATIGLQTGGGEWANNHPRPRNITHVVQLVHRPGDHAPYISEAQGMSQPYGLRLLSLADWIERARDELRSGSAWAVSPFLLTK